MCLSPHVIPQGGAFCSGGQLLSGGITGCRHTENTISVANVFPSSGWWKSNPQTAPSGLFTN